MSQCQIQISPPPYEPYSYYWDDYEPPPYSCHWDNSQCQIQISPPPYEPYSSHWDNYEPLQAQWQQEEKPDVNDVLVKLMDQINERCDRIERDLDEKIIDRMVSQLSMIIDTMETQLAQRTLYLQTKSTTYEESKQYRESILRSNEEFYRENNPGEEILKKNEKTPTEGSQIKIVTLTEGSQIEKTDSTNESGCEENEKDPLVHELEKEEKALIFGQIVLTIGGAVIEVHKGNMQDLFLILQDPSIVVDGDKIKILPSFEFHPPREKRKNNVNHIVRKLRRYTALDVKFSLGEPPD